MEQQRIRERKREGEMERERERERERKVEGVRERERYRKRERGLTCGQLHPMVNLVIITIIVHPSICGCRIKVFTDHLLSFSMNCLDCGDSERPAWGWEEPCGKDH